MIIITKNKQYYWDLSIFKKNMLKFLTPIILLILYFTTSTIEFRGL